MELSGGWFSPSTLVVPELDSFENTLDKLGEKGPREYLYISPEGTVSLKGDKDSHKLKISEISQLAERLVKAREDESNNDIDTNSNLIRTHKCLNNLITHLNVRSSRLEKLTLWIADLFGRGLGKIKKLTKEVENYSTAKDYLSLAQEIKAELEHPKVDNLSYLLSKLGSLPPLSFYDLRQVGAHTQITQDKFIVATAYTQLIRTEYARVRDALEKGSITPIDTLKALKDLKSDVSIHLSSFKELEVLIAEIDIVLKIPKKKLEEHLDSSSQLIKTEWTEIQKQLQSSADPIYRLQLLTTEMDKIKPLLTEATEWGANTNALSEIEKQISDNITTIRDKEFTSYFSKLESRYTELQEKQNASAREIIELIKLISDALRVLPENVIQSPSENIEEDEIEEEIEEARDSSTPLTTIAKSDSPEKFDTPETLQRKKMDHWLEELMNRLQS